MFSFRYFTTKIYAQVIKGYIVALLLQLFLAVLTTVDLMTAGWQQLIFVAPLRAMEMARKLDLRAVIGSSSCLIPTAEHQCAECFVGVLCGSLLMTVA
jgi:hypothetical protein